MKPVSMRALALAAALAGVGVPALAGELSPQLAKSVAPRLALLRDLLTPAAGR